MLRGVSAWLGSGGAFTECALTTHCVLGPT